MIWNTSLDNDIKNTMTISVYYLGANRFARYIKAFQTYAVAISETKISWTTTLSARRNRSCVGGSWRVVGRCFGGGEGYKLSPELSSRVGKSMDVEVDIASSEEGGDVVQRGVDCEGSLDGA